MWKSSGNTIGEKFRQLKGEKSERKSASRLRTQTPGPWVPFLTTDAGTGFSASLQQRPEPLFPGLSQL